MLLGALETPGWVQPTEGRCLLGSRAQPECVRLEILELYRDYLQPSNAFLS